MASTIYVQADGPTLVVTLEPSPNNPSAAVFEKALMKAIVDKHTSQIAGTAMTLEDYAKLAAETFRATTRSLALPNIDFGAEDRTRKVAISRIEVR